ncbi:MAG: T9SS type A sorting domain-containing protein, partial [Bacteroidota bacterium]
MVWSREIQQGSPVDLAIANGHMMVLGLEDDEHFNFTVLDLNGNLTHAKTLSSLIPSTTTPYLLDPRAVITSIDQNFLIAQEIHTPPAQGNVPTAISLTEVNSAGDVYWSTRLDFPSHYGLQLNSVCQSVKGEGYILTGAIQSAPSVVSAFIIFVDERGNYLWAKFFEEGPFNVIRDAISYRDQEQKHNWLTVAGHVQIDPIRGQHPFIAQFEITPDACGLRWYKRALLGNVSQDEVLLDIALVDADYQPIFQEAVGAFLLGGGLRGENNDAHVPYNSHKALLVEFGLSGDMEHCPYQLPPSVMYDVVLSTHPLATTETKLYSLLPLSGTRTGEHSLIETCPPANRLVNLLPEASSITDLHVNTYAPGAIYIKWTGTAPVHVNLIDLTGKVLIQDEYLAPQISLDTPSLSPGIYILRIQHPSGKGYARKVIVR